LGFNEGFPWYDPFAEVTHEEDLEEIVSWIDGFGPETLLRERLTRGEIEQIPHRVKQIRDIVEGLGRYTLVREESGWWIYRRLNERGTERASWVTGHGAKAAGNGRTIDGTGFSSSVFP
jgi:hypothetical protein